MKRGKLQKVDRLENEKASEENEGTWQGDGKEAGAKNAAER